MQHEFSVWQELFFKAVMMNLQIRPSEI